MVVLLYIEITIQLKGVGMADIQYVTDESRTPLVVQIPIRDWELIKAELRPYDARWGRRQTTGRQTTARNLNLMVLQVE